MEARLPFVGMAKEMQRLRLAFRVGDPLLLLGPPGSGKTRLIQEASTSNDRMLYIAWQPTLHALLTSMARALIAARHAGFIKLANLGADPETWLAVQTSIHLKGLLWTAMEGSPLPMMLDGIAGASFPAYRFLQRVYHTPGMALFAASRDTFRLGALARLFWDPTKALTILPLPERDAEQLFDAAASHFKLRNLDLDVFRKKVLRSARGNPGQIIEMCRLATQPQYHQGRHIKFSPLRIDTALKFNL
jgi:hypothetical protein